MISIHSLDLKNPPLYCKINENSSDSYEDVFTNVLQCSEILVSALGDYLPSNQLDVFFFNSGNGNFSIATFCDKFSIFDAGGNISYFKAVCTPILSVIQKNRILGAIVLSHNDRDHVGFIDSILGFLNKDNLETVSVFTTTDVQLPDFAYKNIYNFDHKLCSWINIKSDECCSDDSVNKALNEAIFGPDIQGQSSFLLPMTPIDLSGNASSLIVSLAYKNKSFLYTGDATSITLESICGYGDNSDDRFNRKSVNRNILQNVSIIVAPHHGSNTNGSNEVLAYVIDKSRNKLNGVVCCSSFTNAKYRHPRAGSLIQLLPKNATNMPKHKISYYKNFNDSLYSKNTNKNIYVTGNSLVGAYMFRVNDAGNISMCNEQRLEDGSVDLKLLTMPNVIGPRSLQQLNELILSYDIYNWTIVVVDLNTAITVLSTEIVITTNIGTDDESNQVVSALYALAVDACDRGDFKVLDFYSALILSLLHVNTEYLSNYLDSIFDKNSSDACAILIKMLEATLNNSNINNSIKNLMELLVINHKNEMIYLLECKNMFGFITQQLIDTINSN